MLELEERNGQEGRLLQLRKNVKDLTLIFKTWKEYTNILALTSAQIIKNRTDVDSEVEIHKSQKEILRNLTSKMHETFLDSIEEDTEEVEVSFEDYLVKINQDRKDKDVSPTSSASMEELDTLMGASQVSDVITSDTLTLKVSEPLELGAVGEAISVESGSSGSSELSL